MAALYFLSILKDSGKTTSQLLNVFKPTPQKLLNLNFESKDDPLDNPEFNKTINELRKKISDNGEILVRKSGTEPVIRIMIQHNDTKIFEEILEEINYMTSKL